MSWSLLALDYHTSSYLLSLVNLHFIDHSTAAEWHYNVRGGDTLVLVDIVCDYRGLPQGRPVHAIDPKTQGRCTHIPVVPDGPGRTPRLSTAPITHKPPPCCHRQDGIDGWGGKSGWKLEQIQPKVQILLCTFNLGTAVHKKIIGLKFPVSL